MTDDEEVRRILAGDDEDENEVRAILAGDDAPAAAPAKEEPGVLDFLSGFIRTATPLSEREHEAFKKYGPSVVGGIASTLLPASIPAQVVGSLALGRGAAATSAYLRDEDIGDAVMDPVGIGLEAGIPAVAGGVGKMLRKPAASAIDDVLGPGPQKVEYPAELLDDANWSAPPTAQAVAGDTFEDRAKAVASALHEAEGIEQTPLTTRQGLRVGFSEANRLLERAGPTGQRAAGILRGVNEGKRQIRAEYSDRLRFLDSLSDAESEQVFRYRRGELPEHQASERVKTASKQWTDEFLDPIGERAEKSVVFDDAEPFRRMSAEDLAERGQVAYAPVRRSGQRARTEPLRGIRRVQTEAFHRTRDELPPDAITDIRELSRRYLDEYAPLIARSEAAGPGKVSTVARGAPGWGPEAVETYAGLLNEGKHFEAKLFKRNMDVVYSGEMTDDLASVQNLASRGNQAVLGWNILTQTPQVATPLWRYGSTNTARGLAEYAMSPALRQHVRRSGATDPGYLGFGSPETARGPGYKMVSAFERFARGPMNAGVLPYARKLAAKVQAGKVTPAVRKQLAEIGLTEADVAGGITDDMVGPLWQRSANRAQFVVGEPGETGAAMTSGLGRIGAGLNLYGPKAWTRFQDDILSPIGQGLRHPIKNRSLLALGGGRAIRAGAYTAPIAVGAEYAKAKLADRDFDMNRALIGGVAQTIGGFPAQIATDALYWGRNPAEALVPPIAGVPGGALYELAQGHPERAAIDALSMLSPWFALARQPVYAMGRE